MRYLCVHCDNRFESDEQKPRCPKCMRVHGIEKMDEKGVAKGKAAERPRWVLPVLLVALVGAASGAYVWWSSSTPASVEGEAPIRPLTESELTGYMRAANVTSRDLVDLLDADEEIENFAERAVQGKQSPLDKARGVTEAIRARATANAFVRWSIMEPRDTTLRTAARTYAALKRDGGREKLYPLEVAAVAVAALRAEGVDAMVAAIYGFPNDRTPPDASGHFGYYGVAVYPGNVGEGTATIFDPYGGHTGQPAATDVRVLSDSQVMGAALNIRAMYRIVREGNASLAFDDSQSAMSLARNLAEVHSAHGAVLIGSGGIEEATREFEAAAQMRNDAPRHNNLASLLMAKQDLEGAAREAAVALERSPDYAPAHATLAALHLQGGRSEDAQRELERAQSLDPDLPLLPMLWAQFWMNEHEMDRALAAGQDAVRRRPEDAQTHLLLASLFRATSRYSDMRREAHLALEKAPASARDRMRAEITARLGATALEEESADDLAEDEEATGDEELGDLPPSPSELRLGSGSRLLGDEAPGNVEGPSLGAGDEEEAPGGGSQLRLGDRSRLQLGGGEGGGLHLNLNE
ncbi:MAG: tetratricopeptide repeat protein [Sandaracinaceae bacterium]|nr:tetratricopeptide repeat protein [Sandaracinaceae bacterium]